jgi:hypothetical protein
VPDSWNAEVYRQRADAWRQKAVLLPEGHEEVAICLEIAGGYTKLARVLTAKAIFPIPQAVRPQGPRISRRPPPSSRWG